MILRRLVLFFSLIALLACSHVKMGAFLLRENLTAADPETTARGKVAFIANCASCHGELADGSGVDAEALTTPPTNFRNRAYTKGPSRIAAHIMYGKGDSMPAFADTLPERTIWDLANYLHSLQPGAGKKEENASRK